jgi:hypothetical protein
MIVITRPYDTVLASNNLVTILRSMNETCEKTFKCVELCYCGNHFSSLAVKETTELSAYKDIAVACFCCDDSVCLAAVNMVQFLYSPVPTIFNEQWEIFEIFPTGVRWIQ